MSEQEKRLYDALVWIALHSSASTVKRKAVRDYGLEPAEAVEMAYDDVVACAKRAIKGIRPGAPEASREGA